MLLVQVALDARACSSGAMLLPMQLLNAGFLKDWTARALPLLGRC
jgi:hypothetical protein